MRLAEQRAMTDETSSAGNLPSRVGRYQITGALGFGAMGAVYKAFDPLIKRTLAIKTIRLDIPRQSPQYASFIERFNREARISGTLSHPNIVTLFDIGEEGGLPFLAMEYVDGCTIASVLEAGTRFKPEKVIGLVSQVAAALDYAHSRGVVHRDIKPSNLIVYEDDKVKVTDFGIAKLADSEITHAGVLLGTPSYMSPEQAMGEKLDGRSDIFSLGVCAFEMLSGQQPFPGANVTAILYKLVHVDPIEPPDLEVNGLVPQKWHDVFHEVLAKKPEDRYQTAGAFVQDLEYCLGAWFTGLGQETIRIPAEETAETATISVAADPEPKTSQTMPLVVPQAGLVLEAAPKAPDAAAAKPMPQAAVEAEAATMVFKTGALGAQAGPTASLPAPQPATENDAATVMLKTGALGSKAGPTASLPAPQPATENDAATVMLKTGALGSKAGPTASLPAPQPATENDAATVMLKTGALGSKAGAAAPVQDADDDAATVVLGPSPEDAIPAGVVTAPPLPGPAEAQGAARVTEATLQQVSLSTVAGSRDHPAEPMTRGSGLRWVLTGAALVLVVAASVAGLVRWQRSRVPAPAETLPPDTTPMAPPPPATTLASPVAAAGSLHVESSPPRARVLLNREPRGTTPLDLAALPFGSYEVRVEQNGFDPQTRTVVLSAEQPDARTSVSLARSVALTASAEILSDPAGAAVAIDGRPAGRTPLRAATMRPGSHRLELALDGYVSWSGALDVVAGQKGRVEVRLQRSPQPAATPAPEVVDLARVYRSDEVDTAPRKLSGSSPSYPSDRGAPRLKSGQKVSVMVQFVVTEVGEIQDLKVVESGGALLDEVVVAAVRTWKFQPATKRGTRVKAQTVFKQTFLGG
jgi:TonB family protein